MDAIVLRRASRLPKSGLADGALLIRPTELIFIKSLALHLSFARGIKAPNKAKKAQSKDRAFLLYGILTEYFLLLNSI